MLSLSAADWTVAQGDPKGQTGAIHYGNAALAFMIRLVKTTKCKRERKKERKNMLYCKIRGNCCLSLPIHPFLIYKLQSPPAPRPQLKSLHPPAPTFTWAMLFPRGIKLTGPVWFRQVGCQCSLQAHGEPWIMDLPWVWVPRDSELPPPLLPVVTGIVNVPLTTNDS